MGTPNESLTIACCIKLTPFAYLEMFPLANPIETTLIMSFELVLWYAFVSVRRVWVNIKNIWKICLFIADVFEGRRKGIYNFY